MDHAVRRTSGKRQAQRPWPISLCQISQQIPMACPMQLCYRAARISLKISFSRIDQAEKAHIMSTIGSFSLSTYSTLTTLTQPNVQPADGQSSASGPVDPAQALMQMTQKMVFNEFSAMEEQRAEDDGE